MVKFWPRWNGNGFCQKNHCSRWFFNGFFTSKPLLSMVLNGFSHFNHWYRWFFQWFFIVEPLPLNEWFCVSPLVSMVFQWFFGSQPLVSMIFPMVFYNWTNAIEWMVCGSPLTSMVYQWFWWKWTVVHKKRLKRKKTWFFQQKHRGKQTLDRLTWSNVTKVSLVNHFSSILTLWLPPVQH